MRIFLDLLAGTLIQGFIYSLIAFGIFITYKILDFPDLSVDGSFPLGAAVTAVLLTRGMSPWLTLPIAEFLTLGVSGIICCFIAKPYEYYVYRYTPNEQAVTTNSNHIS